MDYDYYWNGTRLEAMTVTQGQNTEKLLFYYDADGAPYALKYYDRAACLWRTFLYVTNLQGDVVALIDVGSGSVAATYEYDAWGRLVSESISPLPAHALLQYNPLTYRGYIYDEETGFYYLQTRYYDPTIGRFINADGYVSTGTGFLGYNMYAYCNNNPINKIDNTGEWTFSISIGFSFWFFGWGASVSLSLSFGTENWGVQFTTSDLGEDATDETDHQMIGFDIGPSIGITVTEKENINDLEGVTTSVGGDVLLGIDILLDKNDDYLGWQWGGTALSFNAHKLKTKTYTLFECPTLNLPKILIDWWNS